LARSKRQSCIRFLRFREGTTINLNGDRTNNHYDHFVIVYPQATQEFQQQEIIDLRNSVPDTVQDKNRYFEQAVSDHLMVRITLQVTVPDDD
jgi:hypothetical protein